MKSLGLNFAKNKMYIVLLEGDSDGVSLLFKDVLNFPQNLSRQASLTWLRDELASKIDHFGPDVIGQKVHFEPKSVDGLFTHGANTGVAHLAADAKGIEISTHTAQSFSAKRFGFTKSDDRYEWLEQQIGSHPPHWNKQMKDAVFAAWSALK